MYNKLSKINICKLVNDNFLQMYLTIAKIIFKAILTLNVSSHISIFHCRNNLLLCQRVKCLTCNMSPIKENRSLTDLKTAKKLL